MKIGVDARPFCVKYPAGITKYLKSIFKYFDELCEDDIEFILYAPKPFKFEMGNLNIKVRMGSDILPWFIWGQTVLIKMLMEDEPDIFWGPVHMLPLMAPKRCKKVLTIHDLIYLEHPETMTLKNIISNRFIIPTSIKYADIIVADSTNTAEDVVKYFPDSKEKVRVVMLGVNKINNYYDKDQNMEKIRKSLGIDYPYFLSLGSYEPRKNLATVYNAFRQLADKLPHHLVCAGPSGWKTSGLQREFKNGPLKDRVHLVGYVPDDIVPALFSCAEAFLFPSIYEGFGLPIIEAMSYGCPVITSNVSSIPEVSGGAAAELDPMDYMSISKHMLKFVQDKQFRDYYIEKGFKRAEMLSWRSTAEKMLKIFYELA